MESLNATETSTQMQITENFTTNNDNEFTSSQTSSSNLSNEFNSISENEEKMDLDEEDITPSNSSSETISDLTDSDQNSSKDKLILEGDEKRDLFTTDDNSPLNLENNKAKENETCQDTTKIVRTGYQDLQLKEAEKCNKFENEDKGSNKLHKEFEESNEESKNRNKNSEDIITESQNLNKESDDLPKRSEVFQEVNKDLKDIDSKKEGLQKESKGLEQLSNELKDVIKISEDLEKESKEICKDSKHLNKQSCDLNKESDNLNKESEDLKKESQDLSKEPEDLSKEPEDLSKEPEDLSKEPEDLSKEPEDLSKEPEDLSKEPEDLSKEPEDLSKESEDLSKELEDVNKESEDLNKKSGDLNQETEDLNKESEELNKKSEDLSKDSENLNKESEDFKKESGNQNKAPEDLNKGSEDLTEVSGDLNKVSEDLNKESEDSNIESEDLKKESADLIKESKDLNKKSEELNKKSEDLNKESKDLNKESEDLNKESADLIKESEDLNKESKDLNKESEDLNKKSEELDKESEDRSKETEDLNKEVTESNKSEDLNKGSEDANHETDTLNKNSSEAKEETAHLNKDVDELNGEYSDLNEKSKETTEPMCQESDKSLRCMEEMSSPITEENTDYCEAETTVFVHVDSDKDDKNLSRLSAEDGVEEDEFQNNEPQEDPIASDDFAPVLMDEDGDDTEQGGDEEQGASEELCIIPDTERIISEEEREAASVLAPLREPTDSDDDSSSTSKEALVEEPKDNEKYTVSSCIDENVNSCTQCRLARKSKYAVVYNKKTLYICDDNCLNAFKEKYGDKVVTTEGDLRVKKLTSGVNNDNMVSKVKFVRHCGECSKNIMIEDSNLSWETMDYCNELCLSKYQKKIGSNCANCHVEVRSHCLGKYCVRFGYDIRQFCSSICLEEYKKGLKVCSYCQKDMSRGGDGFLAPVGDKGQFKDFCTQQCMQKYDIMRNNRGPATTKPGNTCSVCLHEKPITIEFEYENKMNLFCGEPCFVAFKFVNNITPGKCDMCRKYFDNKILEENSMFYDNAQHSFCSKTCQNIYIITHRKIVPCSWCKVKKYNFDMIKRNFTSGPTLTMCSLHCLSLYHVSINAVHSKKIKCDNCSKSLQPLYHLTMSDATMRNFCSYTCVMAFQSQFAKTPITLNEPEDSITPVPTSGPKRSKNCTSRNLHSPTLSTDIPTIPVISNVQSLATSNGPMSTIKKNGRGTSTEPTASLNSVTSSAKQQIRQHVLIRPMPTTPQRNVGTLCKAITRTKCIQYKTATANKEVQTDDLQDKTIIIPVPVPIYVPAPMWMYSLPLPIPFPFPLPVPVPIFIPTTRNSATGIMKEIKKIQVKIPTDPFEAELLMMAEMVAGDKKEEHTDSESDEEDTTAGAPEVATFSPEPVDASNTFGDDMLQMALKMATELDEPAVDLEGALTASTITASQTGETTTNEESVDESQSIQHIIERQAVRGRKRCGRPPKSGVASKRGRRSTNQIDIPLLAPPQPAPPPEPIEKPDANMCLKYTFGVNAWKQWVTTKNAELEKSSRRVKLFKPEILQLTADELNYSLCLFVKEVRKPNGQEYAPDTIYYLCLGIQQYLFESGRIDNIFCDTYYEKFTDCLDEVAKKFSVLYNDSHYIVTRVEEEHLWESKQLGAHSPHVLLSTLMFFNTKHFNLTTVDEHMQLSFSHIMKHWKRNPNQPGTNKVAGSRNVLLRFYPPQSSTDATTRKKKVYEQQENEENPLRCPVKLYEFYLSKCPESVKTRNDVFYLLPERSCVPDSPVWYSTMPLPRAALEKMLHRVKMVKEINVALLTS